MYSSKNKILLISNWKLKDSFCFSFEKIVTNRFTFLNDFVEIELFNELDCCYLPTMLVKYIPLEVEFFFADSADTFSATFSGRKSMAEIQNKFNNTKNIKYKMKYVSKRF